MKTILKFIMPIDYYILKKAQSMSEFLYNRLGWDMGILTAWLILLVPVCWYIIIYIHNVQFPKEPQALSWGSLITYIAVVLVHMVYAGIYKDYVKNKRHWRNPNVILALIPRFSCVFIVVILVILSVTTVMVQPTIDFIPLLFLAHALPPVILGLIFYLLSTELKPLKKEKGRMSQSVGIQEF